MKRRTGVLLATFCVLMAACTAGGSENIDPGGPAAADAGNCEELRDLVVTRITRIVDLAGDMSTDEVTDALNDAASSGAGPFAFALSSAANEEISDRSDELGCETIDVGDLCSEMARIRTTGVAAQNLLNALLRPCEGAGP